LVDDEPIARVQAALDGLNWGLRVVSAYWVATAAEAATAAGCAPGQIVKSLVFVANERPLLLLIAGDRRADLGLISPLLGLSRKRIKMASAGEVLAITGFAVGGVPPFGHARPLETLIDDSFDRFDELVAAGGTAHARFRLGRALLVELSRGRVAAISVPATA
jgi:prolyl-tRNA editing enzyme YbaK/EbsC (Cys-tRNA(Pro) deacylase)